MIRTWDSGLEYGIDRPGNDITGRPFSAASASSCKTTCTKHVDCRAFTFHVATGNCFLKKGVMAATIAGNDVVSGLPNRYLEGFDTPGLDIPGSDFSTTNIDECANACAMNQSCNAFTLNNGNNRCYLKNGGGNWTANANCTSGIRRRVQASTDHVGGDLSQFST